MRQTNDSAPDGIYIRETIGGVPTEKPSASRKAARKKSESVVTTLKSDPYIWGIYLMLLLISIIELYSASASEVVSTNVYAPLIRHGMFLGIGFALLYLVQRAHYAYIRRARMPALPTSQSIFQASSLGSHRLPDDQSIFDQLPYLLTEVDIGDFIGLVGVQPDLLFTTAQDARGKPLL